MSHQMNQYEFYCRHLEYQDSNVLKILSIFFSFLGLFIFKIEDFYSHLGLAMMLVFVVGLVFFILLYRTQELISELKKNINKLDENIAPELKKTIFPLYLSRPGFLGQLRRTSVIGCWSISITTILVLSQLAFRVF